MKSFKIALIIFSFTANLVTISAQDTKAQASNSDDVIVQALTDEMNRSLTQLKLNTNKPPFFIANYFSDGKVYFGSATLGAIIQSKESPMRNGSFRLLVGDYKVSDENYQEASRGFSGGQRLAVPAENDYLAIRRYFWSTIDKSYKSGIEKYSQKLTSMKQQNTDPKALIDDYTKMSPLVLKQNTALVKTDQPLMEKYLKVLSAIFKQYPAIQSSTVNALAVNSEIFMVNSEGSLVKTTISVAGFAINASAQAADGEILNDHILRYAGNSSQLPSLQSLQAEVSAMASELNNRCQAPIVKEAYQGTVVFEADALAELFNIKFFGRNGLLSNREPIYAIATTKAMSNKIDTKIGKRLCNENLTFTTQSQLSTFNNSSLIGAFDIDAEAVKPTSDLKIIENGILKTLLSDRVPTASVPQSNGHSRFNLFGGYAKSPGVVNINYANGTTYQTLLQNVAAETAKNGLQYYYIIRKLETSNFAKYFTQGSAELPKPVAIFEVSVATGAQKMVRCANISDFPMLSFKYILGGTTEQLPYNFLSNQQVPVSFIVPKAIAFNDISIEKDNSPKAKLPLVPSPLAAK